jgi:ketosteroid isomerase-like protein
MRRPLIIVATLAAIVVGAATYNDLNFAPAHASEEDEIRQMLDRWVVAFRARDIPTIMSIYAPDVVAYDMVPPLRFRGVEAYRKDYEDYFDAFDGPVNVELRDVAVIARKYVAVAFGLERFNGKLKGGDAIGRWRRC